MKLFSIGELERFSDVKAHTIRTWEKRYNLFNPQRNSGNLRRYTLEEVNLLLSVSLLAEYGSKISTLTTLASADLVARLQALKADAARQRISTNKLINCMFESDTYGFEAALDDAVMAWGIDEAIKAVILPFLDKVQLLSYRDTSIEVHFAVTAIRRKLILAIERTTLADNGAKTALLFLPKDEHYDLLLLYMNYVIKKSGLKVLYLGTNISVDNLINVAKLKNPDYLLSYIASRNNFPLEEYRHVINLYLPESHFYVCYADESNKLRDVNHPRLSFVSYKKLNITLLQPHVTTH